MPSASIARRSTVGLAILAIGLLAGALLLVWGITASSSALDGLARGPVPDADLTLEAGDQTVFLEGADVWNGAKVCSCPKVFATKVQVRGDDGPLDVTSSGSTYSDYNLGGQTGNDHGVSVATVTIPRDGRYRVHTESAVGDQIAVGAPDLTAGAVPILAGVGFMALALITAVFRPWRRRPSPEE